MSFPQIVEFSQAGFLYGIRDFLCPTTEALITMYEDSECRHDGPRAVRGALTIAGTITARSQCLHCGDLVGAAVKMPVRGVSAADVALRDSWIESRRTDFEQIKACFADWRKAQYDIYLASPEWRELRIKVLNRDKHICQGCLVARATEVHHRTYDRFGHEFAFDLLSLCNPCHRRFHLGTPPDLDYPDRDPDEVI